MFEMIKKKNVKRLFSANQNFSSFMKKISGKKMVSIPDNALREDSIYVWCTKNIFRHQLWQKVLHVNISFYIINVNVNTIIEKIDSSDQILASS